MNLFPYTPELKPFQDADDAWSHVLCLTFGKDAGQARYEPRGKGAPGTHLRRIHDVRMAAQATWHNSAYRGRVA